MIDGLDIPSLLLDPQNELEVIEQAYERIRAASNNTITDFNPSSPVAALIEGQAYVYMELLWYLNQLPEALALEVLRLAGVTRSAGTKARGILTFTLSSSLATQFVVSQGFVIPYRDSGFQTLATLVIPPGSIEATVPVEAMRTGADMNIGAYGFSTNSTGLSFLQNIYNASSITGGTGLEPLSETLQRAQIALRSRDVLVTARDYEIKAAELLGVGSTATAYPLLSSDKSTQKVGHIHIFAVDSEGNKPSETTCQSVQGQLQALSFAGSSVWLTPVDLYTANLDISITAMQLSDDLADDIFNQVLDYLSPASFVLGASIRVKELEYLVRSVEGVTEVFSLLINEQSVNLAMPNKFTQPKLGFLAITVTDPTGYTQTYYRAAEQDLQGDA